jgi:hypothetical protein
MNDEINQIQESLTKIKAIYQKLQSAPVADEVIVEIPELVIEIINFLQPLLTPYEAAFYWYLFTKTIVETKRQEGVFSIRGLCNGVVWPSRATQAKEVPQNHVAEVMKSLEEKGVIVRIGETTRIGTPYKINMPEEIEICREKMKVVVSSPDGNAVDSVIDFYNIKHNRLKIYERDGYKCYKCGKLLTRWDATLDHILPVSRGGSNSKENLMTCCLMCNSRRRNREIEIEDGAQQGDAPEPATNATPASQQFNPPAR